MAQPCHCKLRQATPLQGTPIHSHTTSRYAKPRYMLRHATTTPRANAMAQNATPPYNLATASVAKPRQAMAQPTTNHATTRYAKARHCTLCNSTTMQLGTPSYGSTRPATPMSIHSAASQAMAQHATLCQAIPMPLNILVLCNRLFTEHPAQYCFVGIIGWLLSACMGERELWTIVWVSDWQWMIKKKEN